LGGHPGFKINLTIIKTHHLKTKTPAASRGYLPAELINTMMNTTMMILFELTPPLSQTYGGPPPIPKHTYMGGNHERNVFPFLHGWVQIFFFWEIIAKIIIMQGQKLWGGGERWDFFLANSPTRTNARESRLINSCTSRVCIYSSNGGGGFRSPTYFQDMLHFLCISFYFVVCNFSLISF
jgi:hypothetical protein